MTRVAAATNVGLKRQRNEDSYYVGKHLVAVADGMGGHVSGDVASSTVIDTIRTFDRPLHPDHLAQVLGQAVYAANEAMRRRVEAEPQLGGMGTTLVAATWSKGRFALANVGDSRIYLLRTGRLCRLTDDHVYERVLSGMGGVPSLDERISRFLDGRADGRSPDLAVFEARPGDRLLLCSDGLSSYVARDTIRAALTGTTPQAAVDRLITVTLAAGAPDNVTVIVLDA